LYVVYLYLYWFVSCFKQIYDDKLHAKDNKLLAANY